MPIFLHLTCEDTNAHRETKVLVRGGGREKSKTRSQSSTAGVHTEKNAYFFKNKAKAFKDTS